MCNGQKEVEHKKLDYRVTPAKAGISSSTTLILGLVGMAKWTGQIVQPVTGHYNLADFWANIRRFRLLQMADEARGLL